MFRHIFLLQGLCFTALVLAQNPLAIPPLLEADTFHLTVDDHVHQFYPGVNTPTFGVNGPYLGPTLLLHRGDTARFRIQNELPQITSMHWHGMHVTGEMDGGPPREIQPGEYWDVSYEVVNPAGTYWYHPHPHELTAAQATKGVAGFMIVQDEEESQLVLPRTYGVDDFPIVLQDRFFLPNGSMATAPYGDSVLVNGTPHPFLECPAQVVRLRLLNGANARVFVLGFDNGQDLHIIGGDGGLLAAPVGTDRLWLSNGERAEILLDLTGMEGDSLMLMSHGSELPMTVPGSNNMLWESSSLNGIDFPLLRIRVVQPTSDPVTVIPTSLVTHSPPTEAEAIRTRTKTLTGNGMVGMGMFMINGLMFDLDVVNDTMQLGSVEIWNIVNASNMAHPMHIHGVSFHILERNGVAPPAWEQGPKDVVLVDRLESVKLIMRFDHPSDGWPFMYHCHNLMHEDNMMMLQYIVLDQGTTVPFTNVRAGLQIHPSPSSTITHYVAPFPVHRLLIQDVQGRSVHEASGPVHEQGTLDVSGLGRGTYVLTVSGQGRMARSTFVRE